jgi:hypothetical protein
VVSRLSIPPRVARDTGARSHDNHRKFLMTLVCALPSSTSLFNQMWKDRAPIVIVSAPVHVMLLRKSMWLRVTAVYRKFREVWRKLQ